ncbi:MORN repeat protein [compost metagenome]
MKTRVAIAMLLCSGLAAAAEPAYVGRDDCRIATNPRVAGHTPDWNGACKDGYASGPGALQWSLAGKETERYEGTLSKGTPEGKGIAQWADGSLHDGSYRDGLLHGAAIIVFADKNKLVARFEQGRVAGDVKFFAPYGDRYEGAWQEGATSAGWPEGSGTMVFALGGSYKGQWHQGKPHGDGEILYPNGQVLKGRFNGSFLLSGKEVAPISTQRFQVKHHQASVGSHLADVAASGYIVPPEKSYARLTPDQQRVVKHAYYPVLQEDDVPPYLANGNAELSRTLSSVVGRLDKVGEIHANVSVDEQGTPRSVALLKVPSRQAGEMVASVLMLAKYTPGRCGGQPCAMAVPFRFSFGN